MPQPLELAAIPAFIWAGFLLYAMIVLGSWALSRLGTVLVKLTQEVFGQRITFLCVDAPSLVLHELSHLLIAILFGHRIKSVSLSGAFHPGKGGHVETLYNPRSFWQRLGIPLMALAPVAIPMTILCVLMLRAMGWPSSGAQMQWPANAILTSFNSATASTVGIAIYAHVLIASTMRLSPQDWRAFVGGAIPWAFLITGIAFFTHSGSSPWAWAPNLLLATTFALTIATKLSIVVLLFTLSMVRKSF